MAESENKELGIIEVNKLKNATGLMKGNTQLTSVNCPFPALEIGNEMFQNCSALISFDSDLSNLINYENMFKGCTKLNTFKAKEINTTETGASFMTNIGLSDAKSTLMYFESNLTNTTNTNNMFNGYTALKQFKGGMSAVTNAQSMFRGCTNLNYFDSYANNQLQDGLSMFRECTNLNENNFKFDNFCGNLTEARAMFQDTGFTKIPENWIFPKVASTMQMFQNTKITGHLKLDMATQFPNVNDAHGQTTTAYMFRYCKFDSVEFDVSTVGNGMWLFCDCSNITKCTGAKFKQGGIYQSMFTSSKFDRNSAQIIYDAAKEANVASLHIGIGFDLTDTDEFVIKNDLKQWEGDNSGRQWHPRVGNIMFASNTSKYGYT